MESAKTHAYVAMLLRTRFLLLPGLVVTFTFSSPVQAAYITGLDLASQSSNFETGAATNLPSLGWTSVSGSGTPRIWDLSVNGVLLNNEPYSNYEVQYTSGTSVQTYTQYTLTFDMGYVAANVGGNSTYSFQLGTWDGSSFSPLGSPKTGSAPYLGSFATAGVVSKTDSLVFTTLGSVSGNVLAIRWAQTGTLGSPLSDYFAIDNVRLDAIAVPVPEPGTLTLCSLAMLGLRRFVRRHSQS